jgi:ankyrin repeat protein
MDERMRRSIALERALRAGDLDAGRAALADPAAYPNAVDGYTGNTVLQLALFIGSVETVTALLAAGADPNFEALDGFPALLLVVLHRDDAAERQAVMADLVAHGADLDARGINDWTALHVAAAHADGPIVRMLLTAGADPSARTRIDDLTTPADEAEAAGHHELARMLRNAEAG